MSGRNLKSLQKAINILNYLAKEGCKGITEISKEFDMSKSSVYNILNTFADNGWVKKNESTEKYQLSLRLFELGNIVRSGFKLREIALPHMKELVEKTDETVHLTIMDEGEIVYVESVQPDDKLAMSSVIGRRAHMHCTGVGKAILAFQPEEVIDKIIAEKGLPRFTPNTITDKEKLKRHLNKIRKKGYSIDNIEHEYGVKCVGAPIRNENGVVFSSMSITGPSPRFPEEKIEEYSVELLKATNEISKKLGWGLI